MFRKLAPNSLDPKEKRVLNEFLQNLNDGFQSLKYQKKIALKKGPSVNFVAKAQTPIPFIAIKIAIKPDSKSEVILILANFLKLILIPFT